MRHSRIFGSAAVAAVAVAMASPASAALVFNSASINVSNSASASSAHGTNNANDSQNDSASTLPVLGLYAEAYSDALARYRRVNQAEGTADTIGTFNFTSASAGTINFNSSTSAAAYNNASSATAYSNGSGAAYTFTAGGNDLFHFSYNISNSGGYFYSNNTALYDLTANSFNFNNFNNTSGANTTLLTAGHSYILTVADYSLNGDYVTQSGIGSQTGSANDTYSFSTTSVPEPATWGMMILGFGMIGLGLRARRRQTKVSFA